MNPFVIIGNILFIIGAGIMAVGFFIPACDFEKYWQVGVPVFVIGAFVGILSQDS